jgi:arylsulfatase A-like enzyme
MKNQIFLIALTTISLCFLSFTPKTTPNFTKQPNVLFISLDDMNDWIQPLGGHPQAQTPHLQAFSKEAVNFTKTYCASPGCNPSRGAILTGMHTYRTGLYSNYQDWRLIPKMANATTLNRLFKNNGYFTAGAGKIYHYEQVDSMGWDSYFPSITKPMPDDNFPPKTPANMPRFKYIYNMFDWGALTIGDEEMGDYSSVRYISEQFNKKHDKPFFLACGIYRPHHPWYVPQAYFDKFPLENIQLPPILENDTADLGVAAKELVTRGGNYHKHVLAAGQWKNAIQGYLAALAFSDAMVGRLLENLSKSAYADNTIVVIWSDHGWQLGQKNHWRKFALWENVNRSVLMIKVPKTAVLPNGSAKGQKTTNLTSLLDIYPTLADLCQLPKPRELDGKSLVPILKNPHKKVLRPIITTYDYGSYSVRYDKWHYIRYIDDSEELYDLDNDPQEWYNLDKKPDLMKIKAKMAGFIPKNPAYLPETSLIPLMQHHIMPTKSKAHWLSAERKEWMKRFED